MDLFLIPSQIVIICAFIYRFQLADCILGVLTKKIENLSGSLKKVADHAVPYLKRIITNLITDIKFELDKWWMTILTPIFISLIVYIGWVMFNNYLFHAFPTTLITDNLFILDSITLGPISEQILQGIFLTMFLVLIVRPTKNKISRSFLMILVLFISAIIMAFFHDNSSFTNFAIRGFQFLIYGTIYYFSNQNLLPTIVAHIAWNTLLLNQIPF